MPLLPVFVALLVAATLSFAGDPMPSHLKIALILTGIATAAGIVGLGTGLLRAGHVMWACLVAACAWLALFTVTALSA